MKRSVSLCQLTGLFGENDEVQRELQRVVAAHRFHNSAHPLQNTVLIEAHHPKRAKAMLSQRTQKRLEGRSCQIVWAAKLLAMLRIRRRPKATPGDPDPPMRVEEKALVQYFDLDQGAPDEVDSALGCPKLRWSVDESSTPGRRHRYFDVLNATTIRGLVHVVRGDVGLGSSKTYKCDGDRQWTKHWFYMNRFKLPRRGAGVSVADDAEHDDELGDELDEEEGA